MHLIEIVIYVYRYTYRKNTRSKCHIQGMICMQGEIAEMSMR